MKTELTQERLRELLSYDQDTGLFTWRKPLNRRIRVGSLAGYSGDGYIKITIARRIYFAQRLAWLYVFGKWPEGEIDHVGGVRDDNRISQLRDVTHSVNQQNLRHAKGNTASGFLGVNLSNGRWQASIRDKSLRRHLGTFDTPEAAHAAYVAAKRVYHAGCTI